MPFPDEFENCDALRSIGLVAPTPLEFANALSKIWKKALNEAVLRERTACIEIAIFHSMRPDINDDGVAVARAIESSIKARATASIPIVPLE